MTGTWMVLLSGSQSLCREVALRGIACQSLGITRLWSQLEGGDAKAACLELSSVPVTVCDRSWMIIMGGEYHFCASDFSIYYGLDAQHDNVCGWVLCSACCEVVHDDVEC
eukprot:TRINITY_DN1780_c0_g2_i1.p3 TRINITY_DN1780_c0_g2~~TRINITY_DN1780_c0_g2_i1.p3  ORF type:complete len:110 (-),score=0.11 TRINITY_DN1780_c0_g2_i1:1380-1709(-)